jgi:16S rRNA (adenine1518-N6/adenine1519-N6)-dimethyltransferase
MKTLKAPKKSLGQNFLIDKNIINKIINISSIDKNSTIIEIGPGYGSLTEAITSLNPKKIVAVEKDKSLTFFLTKKFKSYKNINIVNEDILDFILKKKIKEKTIVFGNLPYNISTKVLASLIMLDKWPPWYETLIFMFQKEVADRIIAKFNTKEYGRLSVLANWRLEVVKHFDISRNCFFPKPKIISTLLSFRPKKNNLYQLNNPKNLENVTRVLFSNRRKMINKSLKKLFQRNKYIIDKLDINLNSRPQELKHETFYKIAKEYEKLFC